MKINFALDLNEDQLRRVRAALGRGGVATRADVRIFAHRAFGAALNAAPTPKPKRVAAPPREEPVDLETLPGNAICKHCGETLERHGRMLGTCSKAGRATTRFSDSGLRKEVA